MRLTPIESPTSPLLWLAYKIIQRKIGTVIMPLKTIYARKPAMLPMLDKISRYQNRPLTINPSITSLIKIYGSVLNGCDFCQDIAMASVVQHKLGEDKFLHLADWSQHPASYDADEQAVLTFVLDYHQNRSVSDETYENLQQYFSESQIIDIVAINAIEQYYNAMNKPFNILSDGLADRQRKQLSAEQRLPA